MIRGAETITAGTDVIEYLIPGSIEETIQILEEYAGAARIIAGGTDILPEIRKEKIHPRCLVDITRIPGLDQIHITQESVELGAAVTFGGIRDCGFFSEHIHALADAARSVGAEAVQNAATWVGNLVQAMPAADGAIIALALDAEVQIVDRNGAQWVPVASLFRGPGLSSVDPARQMVAFVRFPRPEGKWGTAWVRMGRRPSLVLPILNCAVTLGLDGRGDLVETARIALGPVAPCPYRAHEAEGYLEGRLPVAANFAQAAQLVQQAAKPRDSITRASRAYRLEIIPAMVEAALETAAQRALRATSTGKE